MYRSPDQIAQTAEFFSFGTNDLTQMTYGLSRDDSVKFLNDYIVRGIYKKDPFQELDGEGVGGLMKIAVERGRKTNKNLKLGICGEHGGDPGQYPHLQWAGAELRIVFAVPDSGRAPGRRPISHRCEKGQARIQGCVGLASLADKKR